MTKQRDWLQAEANGQDELAERLFADWAAEMPRVAPTGDFASRVGRVAWEGGARRRAAVRLAQIAAVLLLGISVAGSVYGLIASGLVARGAVLLSHGLVWVLTSTGEGTRWWGIAGRIGNAVSISV